ncbi:hypothetical protein PSET11_00733 [Arthrobacter ulcerisalmonis]|uniref:Uncharacterized protein n=1 Tax=Arthrobacter ulcerisalmonis TaxID=2483813 RepID=A0A3P5WPB6_9MICC|nr:hypothetical protein [Arthrobacter ulcerisalmonis]VDC21371.1 hypothetical protein PSET11_00733 [Arthrobacter ulcerisalmonis]
MLTKEKTKVTRVHALDQLHRGDEIEARMSVGPSYDDVVIRRGRVQETAPGIGVLWILDRFTGARRIVNTDECTVWRIA